jgi:hypothetical protein
MWRRIPTLINSPMPIITDTRELPPFPQAGEVFAVSPKGEVLGRDPFGY